VETFGLKIQQRDISWGLHRSRQEGKPALDPIYRIPPQNKKFEAVRLMVPINWESK
jgi:hypothetical protein